MTGWWRSFTPVVCIRTLWAAQRRWNSSLRLDSSPIGGIRSRRSSSETRLFYGTTSKLSQRPARAHHRPGARRATASYRRHSAPVRASDTCRASTETPGSSTLRLSLDPFHDAHTPEPPSGRP